MGGQPLLWAAALDLCGDGIALCGEARHVQIFITFVACVLCWSGSTWLCKLSGMMVRLVELHKHQ
jgi:hypothetical protein